jgi:hypothetical protein
MIESCRNFPRISAWGGLAPCWNETAGELASRRTLRSSLPRSPSCELRTRRVLKCAHRGPAMDREMSDCQAAAGDPRVVVNQPAKRCISRCIAGRVASRREHAKCTTQRSKFALFLRRRNASVAPRRSASCSALGISDGDVSPLGLFTIRSFMRYTWL